MLRGAASEVVRAGVPSLTIDALKERAAAANAELYNLGITFTIYSAAKTIDRILPFDGCRGSLRQQSGVTSRAASYSGSPH
jgi:hypothetical protein